MKTRLICCRTPLQALIAARIQEEHPARDFILYYPTSESPKHKAYFNRLRGESRFFCAWKGERPSHLLSELSAIWRSRRWLRSLPPIDEQLVSSFPSVLFAAAHGRLRTRLASYDDGFMNLSEHEMGTRLASEARLHLLAKRAFGGKGNRETLEASDNHYTIFDPAKLAYPYRRCTRVPLFDRAATERQDRGTVTVLLGTTIRISSRPVTPEIVAAYDQVLQGLGHQVFLAHPGDEQRSHVSPDLPEAAEVERVADEAIAEEVIVHLARLGYRVKVYGFGSTALLNVAAFAETFNIVIPGVNEHEAPVFEAVGVPAVPFEQACAAAPGGGGAGAHPDLAGGGGRD